MAKHLSFSTIYNILFSPFQEPNFDHILDLTQRSKAQESVIPKKLKNLLGTNEPDEALLTRLKNFLSQYDADKALVSKLFGENFAFQQNNNPTKLIQIFSELNSEYAFFKDDSKLQDFIKCYIMVHYYFEVLQNADRLNIDQIAEISYKIVGFFGENSKTLENLDKFIIKELSQDEYAIDTFAQYSLPMLEDEPSLSDWYKLRDQSGKLFLKHFHKAQEIQKANNNHVPENKNSLATMALKVDYPKSDSDKDFAKLLQTYKVPNDVFEGKLELEKLGLLTLKTRDLLPDVHININDEYHIIKLPAGNARGFILGHITNCCQSILNHSHQAVIDGMSKDTSGFYVLVKPKTKNFDITKIDWARFEEDGHQIVGQAYAWFSTSKNLVLDSWENLRPENHDELVVKHLTSLAEKIIAESNGAINRVSIGLGGKTPSSFKQSASYAEYIGSGYFYGDAATQAELQISGELRVKREEVKNKTGIEKQDHIVSIEQANIILSFSDETLAKIKVNYEFWTNLSIIQELRTNEDMLERYQTLADLKNSDEARYNILVNSQPLKQVLLNKMITFNELVKFETPILKFLDDNPRTIEVMKLINYDLREFTKNSLDQRELLFSPAAAMLYMHKKLTSQEILGANTEETMKNIAKKVAIYSCGESEIEYIDHIDHQKLSTLISPVFLALYERKKATLHQMNTLPDQIFEIFKEENFSQIVAVLCLGYEVPLDNFFEGGYDKIPINILKKIATFFAKENNIDYIDNLSPEYISLLLSPQCISLYFSHNIKVARLAKLSQEQLSTLFSSAVPLTLIQNYSATLTDFVDESLDQMKRNIAEYIAKIICKTKLKMDDIDIALIDLLISKKAFGLYCDKKCTISELATLTTEQASELLDRLQFVPIADAIEAGLVTIPDLIELVQIKDTRCSALYNAMMILVARKLTFEEFKQFFKQSDDETYAALLSREIANLVSNGIFTFSELQDLFSRNQEQFRNITKLGDDIIWSMIKDNLTTFTIFKDMLEQNPKKFSALVNYEIFKLAQSGSFFNEINAIFDNDIVKFEALTSESVLNIIKKEQATFVEMKNLYETNLQEFERITLVEQQEIKLQSWQAQDIIKMELSTLESLRDLVKHSIKKFDTFISSRYKINNKLKQLDLVKLLIHDEEKFEAMVDYPVQKLLKIDSIEASDLLQILTSNPEKFKALTSYEITDIIQKGDITFAYLEELYDKNHKQFSDLVQSQAETVVENCPIKVDNIASLYDIHSPE